MAWRSSLWVLPILVMSTFVQGADAASQPLASEARAAVPLAASVEAAGAVSQVSAMTSIPDYPLATWVSASSSNYTVANRAHDYTIDMIVIHDIEGSYGSAIKVFQDPGRKGSAHYVISYKGQITQMVAEHNIAWHAGNWDYNTRAIGIEHEGFAWTPGLYTAAEYKASAQLTASICSRWAVQLDRTHVIGHNQVPDPNNPSLFGGSDHHTDPGPYWNWTYYIALARNYAAGLPSPPVMMPDPVAVNGLTSVTVTWKPARTCRPADAPIKGYTVVAQPGGMTMTLPATATTATFNGLTMGTTYTFSVTATNTDSRTGVDGLDTAVSNPSTPGRCSAATLSASPASPQKSGTSIHLTAAASGCPNPSYEYWVLAPGAAAYQLAQPYSTTATFDWSTLGKLAGIYRFSVWTRDAASPGNFSSRLGTWDASANGQYTLTPVPCTSTSVIAAPASPTTLGTSVTFAATSVGCANPSYEFWMLPPGGTSWQIVQPYSTDAHLVWATAGWPAGTYRITAWARDASSGGTTGNGLGTWDSTFNGQHTLTTVSCGGVAASISPPTSSPVGTPVSVTAVASGCPTPLYQFWMLSPGSSTWQLAKPYSTSGTFSWSTIGKRAGVYRITVWVRDAAGAGKLGNSLGRWDVSYNTQHSLT
jgi:N-acetyl-anhydromuramyl-L-alanine amidase AmpD